MICLRIAVETLGILLQKPSYKKITKGAQTTDEIKLLWYEVSISLYQFRPDDP